MLVEVTQFFSDTLKANPMLAALAIPLGGYVGFLARNLPRKSFKTVWKLVTVELELSDERKGGFSGQTFSNFGRWHSKSRWGKHSRSLTLSRDFGEEDDGAKVEDHVIPGLGLHFFFMDGRLFWFYKDTMDKSGFDRVINTLIIRTFGRSQKPIRRLIAKVNPPNANETIAVHRFSSYYWNLINRIERHAFDALVLNDKTRADVLRHFDHFVNNKQWYIDNGMPHKITAMFTGEPGTGKTSLIRAIACHFNLNLLVLDLSEMSNESLARAMSSAPRNSMVVIEDIDATTSATNSREGKLSGARDDDEDQGRLTLAGVLNALDGVVPLQSVAVCITTNYPDHLDPALMRKSRIDHIFDVGRLTGENVLVYGQKRYGEGFYIDPATVLPVRGCDLHGAFLEHPDDPEGFVTAVQNINLPKPPLTQLNG